MNKYEKWLVDTMADYDGSPDSELVNNISVKLDDLSSTIYLLNNKSTALEMDFMLYSRWEMPFFKWLFFTITLQPIINTWLIRAIKKKVEDLEKTRENYRLVIMMLFQRNSRELYSDEIIEISLKATEGNPWYELLHKLYSYKKTTKEGEEK